MTVSAMGQKSPPAEKPAHNFESAIGRLEEIVVQMEGNQLPLEQLLERFEEGSKLVQVCQEKLESAERRIEILTRGSGSKPQVAEFEPAAAPPSHPQPAKAPAVVDEVSLF